MFSGDDLEKMLNRTMQTQTPCRKCETPITFEEGANYARENGINDKVVMCQKCHSVYEVDVTPGGITLLADVTNRYPPPRTTPIVPPSTTQPGVASDLPQVTTVEQASGIEKQAANLSTKAETKKCPYCAEEIRAEAIVCRFCGKDLQIPLSKPTAITYPIARERPGCVTAYAVLLGIVSVLIGVGGFLAGLSQMGSKNGDGVAGLIIIVGAAIVGGLYFLLARGLWRLKNWARIIIIVLQGLGALVGVLSLCAALGTSSSSGSDPAATLCGQVIGLAIGGYILYWFASHGEYFD